MASGVKLTGPWRKMALMLDPKYVKIQSRKYIRIATAINAKKAEAMIRQNIVKGVPPSNKALTIMIKGSSKPLVGTGEGLFQAVTSKVTKYNHAHVGIFKSDESFNIARAIHEGATIKVTKKMRGLFWLLWLVSKGKIPSSSLSGRAADLWNLSPGGWKPILKTTQAILIPPRPFVTQVFRDPKLHAFCQANWHAAIAKVFT